MISRLCLARPVAISLLTLGILLLGILAYASLPIAALPSVDRPTISVFASLPGASPDTMAASVGAPLERQLGIIPGIAEMGSISTSNAEEIDIQFTLDKTLDSAAGAVQAAINAALPDLPKDLPQPPTYYKADPGRVAMIVLALTSDVLQPGEVYEVADSVVSQKLSQITGVSRVVINGAERAAVRVRVDPRRLAGLGLSMESVRAAVNSATREMPKGRIDEGEQSFALAANDQLFRAADFRRVVVNWTHGAPVLLGDIADVQDSVLNDRQAGWFGRDPAVSVLVFRQPDANIVATVNQVLATLPQLSHWMPPSIKVHVVFDRTTLIRASIADVERTIGIAIVLVVLVIALFVRRLWATVIPAVTIPVVLAGTMAVMALLGYSLDNLSLMALTIAVGFVVDDAVIIIENVIRRMERGADAGAATLGAIRQMGTTIISITAALIAALIPVLFMPDIVGRYFREFGLTLVAAIILSALISLTLTPMMCAHLLSNQPTHAPESRRGRFDRIAGWPLAGYTASLDWCLRHRHVCLVAALLIAGATYGLYARLPKGFMPTQDTGVLHIVTVANPSVSFTEMSRLQQQVDDVVMADPAIAGLSSYIGGGVMSTGNLWIGLKNLDERGVSIQAVIARLRPKLADVAGIRAFLTPVQDLNIGLGGSASRYQYRLTGTDVDEVIRAGEALRLRMIKLPEITDVISNIDTRAGLQAGLIVDRMQAGRFGVTPMAVDNTLYDAFGQRQTALIYLPLSYSKVVMEVDPRLQGDPSSLASLYVPGGNGAQVPLAQLTRLWRAHAPMWVRHAQQFPTMALSFDTRPGVSIGQAIAAIRAAQASLSIPDEVKSEFTGEAGEASKSAARQALLFLGAVIAVYIVLGVLYENYAHPLTILSTLPSASFGAVLALWLTGTEFSIMTAIACILVVGIVMKNAILMIDVAIETERATACGPRRAIREAALLRARPITMTMLVAMLSAVPLALGTGAGHELRQPLGIAIVGGLLVSQFLTLYTTPVIYVVLDSITHQRKQGWALPPVAIPRDEAVARNLQPPPPKPAKGNTPL
jgi:hydrophobe/amphiphile efflux-1 (HAE1) family protein